MIVLDMKEQRAAVTKNSSDTEQFMIANAVTFQQRGGYDVDKA